MEGYAGAWALVTLFNEFCARSIGVLVVTPEPHQDPQHLPSPNPPGSIGLDRWQRGSDGACAEVSYRSALAAKLATGSRSPASPTRPVAFLYRRKCKESRHGRRPGRHQRAQNAPSDPPCHRLVTAVKRHHSSSFFIISGTLLAHSCPPQEATLTQRRSQMSCFVMCSRVHSSTHCCLHNLMISHELKAFGP